MPPSHLISPYQAWNLWRNPFGELTRAERADLAVLEGLPAWLDQLQHPRTAIQFLGPCGHGKTTHLLALHRALENATYIYYPESGRRPPLPRARPLLIDEAQRMGRCNLLRMLWGPGPLVIGTHRDLRSWLRRAGFETVSVDMGAPLPTTALLEILNRRIAASSLSEGEPELKIDRSLAESLLRKFGSNVRAIEGFLYEHLQATLTGRASWPPAI
jgi:hypothetical protein